MAERTVLDIARAAIDAYFDAANVIEEEAEFAAPVLTALGIPLDCPAGLVGKALRFLATYWTASDLTETEWDWLNGRDGTSGGTRD